jgi:hypothetical protein
VSMYLLADRTVEVVEDATGDVRWSLPGTLLVDLKVTAAGDAFVTWRERGNGEPTVWINLRRGPLELMGMGTLPTSPSRPAALADLQGMGVKVVERGSRLSDAELGAAREVLHAWAGPDTAAAALKRTRGVSLSLVKDVAESSARYRDEVGEVRIPGNLERSPEEQRNTVVHELTHALYDAAGLRIPPGKTSLETAPAGVRSVAADARQRSADQAIDEGAFRGRRPDGEGRRSERQWVEALSKDPEIDRLWVALHRRFPIADVEKTLDLRGLDVADESRYLNTVRGDRVGHGFDNVTEFLSSFVTCAMSHQDAMVRTVTASRSPLLAELYRDVWSWVNAHMVRLRGPNPFVAAPAGNTP